jgi:hypothetical protein
MPEGIDLPQIEVLVLLEIRYTVIPRTEIADDARSKYGNRFGAGTWNLSTSQRTSCLKRI